jgi:glycerate 2-kinase
MPHVDTEHLLRDVFAAAIDAARPSRCVPPALPLRPRGRTVVIGAGKAAAAMARAVEEHWDGDLGGTVVTARGHAVACRRIEVIESAHRSRRPRPVPAVGRRLGAAAAAGRRARARGQAGDHARAAAFGCDHR